MGFGDLGEKFLARAAEEDVEAREDGAADSAEDAEHHRRQQRHDVHLDWLDDLRRTVLKNARVTIDLRHGIAAMFNFLDILLA